MLHLYHSPDRGLLEHQAHKFRLRFPNAKHVRNPSAADLELLLIQRNLDGEIENLIIDQYGGSLDVLAGILHHAGLENTLILLAHPPAGEIVHFLDNSERELPKLTEVTKRGHLVRVIRERYPELSKIPKPLLREIKAKVPPCGEAINSLLFSMSELLKSGELTEEMVMGLVGSFRRRYNPFDFLRIYLAGDDWGKWINFYNGAVICDETFRHFSYALSHQLLELKRYLSLREKHSDSKEIAALMKVPAYAVSPNRKLFERYGSRLMAWLDNFIIDLYFFQFSLVHSCSVNCALLKCLLLRKRRELSEGDRR